MNLAAGAALFSLPWTHKLLPHHFCLLSWQISGAAVLLYAPG
jgi:hypothetical protein